MSKQPWKNRIVGHAEVSPTDLVENPRNWRAHPKHQQDALAGVLREVGLVQSVIISKNSGFILDGHLRVALAVREKQETLPVVYVDLTEAEETLVLATIDPISAMADTDNAKLDALLREVSTSEEAVQTMLGELAEKSGILFGLAEPGDGGDDFDVTPEETGPTRTNVGDLWSIGGVHRLLVGDCTDEANVEQLMCNKIAALCVTDPPYGVNYDPEWRDKHGVQFGDSVASGSRIVGDDSFEWLHCFDFVVFDVLYAWIASTSLIKLQSYLEQIGFDLRYYIVWNKDLSIIGRGDYHWKHEMCLYMVRKSKHSNWQGKRDQKTVWDIPAIHSFATGHNAEEWGLVGHGNQKPLECMLRPIQNNTQAGEIVYDPFLGSGTTLIAAHRTGRRCYGLETEPRYADVILRRAEAEGLVCELVLGAE